MCIRDSHDAYQEMSRRIDPFHSQTNPFGHHFVDQRKEYRNCLLYTSDAADERSSVDLGGRRIIKKKKQEKKSGLQ